MSRTADQLTRRDYVILDELGYLPFAQTGGQLLFHLMSRLSSASLRLSAPEEAAPREALLHRGRAPGLDVGA